MAIISKQSWDKLTQEEQHKLKSLYMENEEFGCAENNIDLERIFPKDCLQPKPLTYEDVEKEMDYYFSDEMMEKEKAIHQILLVAKFLNKDWKPDFSDADEEKWFPCIGSNGKIEIHYATRVNYEIVYFRTEELAKQAIQILGEDVIRLALTTEY